MDKLYYIQQSIKLKEKVMTEMIAFCGLDCASCGAFIATKNNDDKKRIEVAKTWSKEYNGEIKPEDINCEGCQSNGVLFGHCKVCKIRKCGLEKKVENCGRCDEYPCAEVSGLLQMVPEAKKRLDKIAAS